MFNFINKSCKIFHNFQCSSHLSKLWLKFISFRNSRCSDCSHYSSIVSECLKLIIILTYSILIHITVLQFFKQLTIKWQNMLFKRCCLSCTIRYGRQIATCILFYIDFALIKTAKHSWSIIFLYFLECHFPYFHIPNVVIAIAKREINLLRTNVSSSRYKYIVFKNSNDKNAIN